MFGPPPPGLLEDLEGILVRMQKAAGLDSMADLIRAQRLAAALAEASGSIPTSLGTWHGQSSFPEMTSGDFVMESSVAAPPSRPPSST